MPAPSELFWNEQRVALIEGVAWIDFPWATGRLAAFSATPELLGALEWLSRVDEAEELEDPPFDAALLDGWHLRSPDGRDREVSAPVVDFEAGTATWR